MSELAESRPPTDTDCGARVGPNPIICGHPHLSHQRLMSQSYTRRLDYSVVLSLTQRQTDARLSATSAATPALNQVAVKHQTAATG